MRIKFLSVIVSFLFVSLAITSCLDTNDDAIEYSSDATIHAFGIDTIHGRHYKFTIDQLNRLIYNADSLPVGSDTIIDRICIDTLIVTGWVTSGIADTLVNINDSIDLRQPIELNVHAADGITTRKYTIKVNVHKQDPDSLVWEKMGDLSATPIIGKQKSVILNGDQLLVYSSNTTAYKTSTDATKYQWSKLSVINLPTDAKLTSIVNFQEKLYMATNSGKVFRSADGATWEEVSTLNAQGVTLVTAYPKTLVGIQTINGKNTFCTSTDKLIWVAGEEVASDFPIEDIYSTVYTTATGVEKALVTGNVSGATETIPWFSMNGAGWASLATERDTFCPGMNNPTIMHYGGSFYIFGGDFSAIYKSLTGIEWYKIEKKFLLPEAFKGRTAYSMTIDKNNYIWIVWGGNGTASNEVWRGRLNKLGFKRQ